MKRSLPGTIFWVLEKYTSCFLVLIALLFISSTTTAQTVTTGKSYINITRPNGGTFLPGDVLEVRATIAVVGGNSTNRINSIRYNDTINLAKFTYIAGSLRMLSNEGKPQVPGLGIPAYTDLSDGDSANIDIPTGRIRFNIGNGAGACNVITQGISIANSGALWGALRPTFFGGTCIRMYVYRVTINSVPTQVDIDSVIRLSAGNFRYRIGSSTTDQLSNFAPYMIKIVPDYGLCTNSIGSNAIVGESGGTFGSGAAQNRAGGTTFVPAPYTFQNFSANQPNDNFYGLANRTSSDGTTNNNVPYSSGAGSGSRVFTVWDIIGDHTGAANPLLGNPPTNTGYAVIINASYQTNRAFTQTINNLCENTYYEFSAWFRNICRRCGCDSSGKGATTTNFVPQKNPDGTNDSSGVKPNLSFQIDGEEYYTSGNIPYSGQWVKKGFVFKTRPGQTSMVVTIRNNGPGGGGNDWAIDDIGVSTCLPNMRYSPSLTPNVCNGNALTIYDTVRSFFDNYTYYKWQRSTDGGTTWTDVSAPFGPVPPGAQPNLHNTGSEWEYVAQYTVPPAQTLPANSGDKYRLIVATSASNLANANCRSTDAANAITMNVITCGPVLNVRLASYNGKVNSNKAVLKWTTLDEGEQLYYDIEKSYDGGNFTPIGTIDGQFNGGSNQYGFTDPQDLAGKTYYRIKMRTVDNRSLYSRILQLPADAEAFTFGSVVNPFTNTLYFDLSAVKAGKVNAELVDQFGKPVRRKTLDIREGINQFFFDNTNNLPNGLYILKVEMDGATLVRKVMKQNP